MNFRSRLRGDLGFIPVLATLIVIAIIFQTATRGTFLLPRNLSNLTLQIATIGTLGIGAVLVLLIGEIDLSLASVSALCSAIMAVLVTNRGWGPIPAILAGIAVGALIGLINGIFIAVLRVPSFIVTLAASIGYAGLVIRLLTQGTLTIRNPFITSISATYLPLWLGFGLPALVLLVYIGATVWDQRVRQRIGLRTKSPRQLAAQLILIAVVVALVVAGFQRYLGVPQSPTILLALVVLFWLLLSRTEFGRHLYAVGGNAEAARRAGIDVVRLRIAVFVLASVLAAVGGILAASRGNSVSPQINPTLLLNAIAAAVIGGVSLFGGRGSVWAVVLGSLIIGSLENGLDLLSQGQDVKNMVQGSVLVIAVTIDALVRRASVNQGR